MIWVVSGSAKGLQVRQLLLGFGMLLAFKSWLQHVVVWDEIWKLESSGPFINCWPASVLFCSCVKNKSDKLFRDQIIDVLLVLVSIYSCE